MEIMLETSLVNPSLGSNKLTSNKTSSTENNMIELNDGLQHFMIAQDINLIATLLLTLTGLVTNSLTIYLLNAVSRADFNQSSGRCNALHAHKQLSQPSHQQASNHYYNLHHTFSSAHLYMLALATSDTLFLIAHFFEDIVPSFPMIRFAHVVNRSSWLCKLALYVRNTARVCSSYLVVCFAYERFSAVKKPLNRLNYDSKRLTKIIIASIVVTFMILNLYTPVVNGLRLVDPNDDVTIDVVSECDVEVEYRSIYVYIMIPYVSVSIIIPILLICYFNISITRMLAKRQHRMMQNVSIIDLIENHNEQVIASAAKSSIKHQISSEEIHETAGSVSLRPVDTMITVNLIEIRVDQSISNLSSFDNNTHLGSSEKAVAHKSQLKFGIEDDSKMCTEQSRLKLQSLWSNLSISSSSLNKASLPKTSVQKQANLNNGSSGSSTLNTNSKCSQATASELATHILLLISACFVLLNLPYVVAWANFVRYEFEPPRSVDAFGASYHRYSIISIAKIFHIANFSINFFLYCLASFRFRAHLMKCLQCREPLPKN